MRAAGADGRPRQGLFAKSVDSRVLAVARDVLLNPAVAATNPNRQHRRPWTSMRWGEASGVERLCRPLRVWLLLPLLASLTMAADLPPNDAGFCPPNKKCHGCGCAGGPGYRSPDGHCVGFRELERTCGTPPTERCTFENAPGTGAHAECALRPRGHQSKADSGGSRTISPLSPAKQDGTD